VRMPSRAAGMRLRGGGVAETSHAQTAPALRPETAANPRARSARLRAA